MLNIPGRYMLTRLDRDFKNGGGIAVYTKNYISLKINRNLSAPSSGNGEIEQLWPTTEIFQSLPFITCMVVFIALLNQHAIIGYLNCDLLRADYSNTKLLIRLLKHII